eukprot:1715819-Rhodomonas_salina.2
MELSTKALYQPRLAQSKSFVPAWPSSVQRPRTSMAIGIRFWPHTAKSIAITQFWDTSVLQRRQFAFDLGATCLGSPYPSLPIAPGPLPLCNVPYVSTGHRVAPAYGSTRHSMVPQHCIAPAYGSTEHILSVIVLPYRTPHSTSTMPIPNITVPYGSKLVYASTVYRGGRRGREQE